MIGVLDYGLGNVGSIVRMFNRIGKSAKIIRNKDEFDSNFGLVLPGVGSFDAAMIKIADLGLIEPIIKHANNGNPLLGICLGMQLLCNGSEEGSLNGFGLIDGFVRKLAFIKKEYRVPNMGWRNLEIEKDTCLFQTSNNYRFYFVHSYYVELKNKELISAYSKHSIKFCAAFQKDNIFGMQFHPEKSHKYGMNILESFSKIIK